MPVQTATLACGCFWSVQRAFQNVKGVHRVVCGYTGGVVPRPNYRMVCRGHTGHVEAVEILFDTRATSYGALLEQFWKFHDPTIDHSAKRPLTRSNLPPMPPGTGAVQQYRQFMERTVSPSPCGTPDIGEQYRSIIFVHDEQQRAVATRSLSDHQRWCRGTILTEIRDAGPFWPAEERHQDHVQKIVDLYDSYLNHG
eukprot:RCo013036